MKKSILLLFLFAFIFIHSNAQVEVGVFGIGQSTIMTSKYTTEHVIQNKATFSSSVGTQLTYYTKSGFGFGLGLMYSHPNQKFDVIDPVTGDNWYSGKKRLQYFKVSALLHYRIVYSDRLNFFFYGGPQVAFLIKEAGGFPVYQTYPGNEYFWFDLIPEHHSNYMNKVTMEAALGWAMEYKLNRNFGIQGGVRLDYGLSQIENKNTFNTKVYNNYNVKSQLTGSTNIAFGITYGVIFHFGSTSLISPSQKFGNKHRPSFRKRRY
jgi:hypothetical protein